MSVTLFSLRSSPSYSLHISLIIFSLALGQRGPFALSRAAAAGSVARAGSRHGTSVFGGYGVHDAEKEGDGVRIYFQCGDATVVM